MKKTKYVTVGLPLSFKERFRQFQPVLGYRTFSEFVVNEIRTAIYHNIMKADRILSEKVDQKLKEEQPF